ncbi:MAG: hypothetical protein RMK64_02520 [Rhodovarius sp.]|nr:hypothetical protein [Rhodovarius sp.]
MRVEIEGDSEAAVALALLHMIAEAEGRLEGGMDREWILSTYRRCLAAVREDSLILDIEEEDEEEEEEEERERG